MTHSDYLFTTVKGQNYTQSKTFEFCRRASTVESRYFELG